MINVQMFSKKLLAFLWLLIQFITIFYVIWSVVVVSITLVDLEWVIHTVCN
jgi:hypothetical protein